MTPDPSAAGQPDPSAAGRPDPSAAGRPTDRDRAHAGIGDVDGPAILAASGAAGALSAGGAAAGAAARAVEHDEIAHHGTLLARARQRGHAKAAALLQKSLDEEYSADRALSSMAELRLNKAAA